MKSLKTNKGRVFIAGGAGCLGSNLVKHLIKRGYAVDCVDNLITGNAENIAAFLKLPTFHFHTGDICDGDLLRKFEGIEYHSIYNLACPTGVPNIAKYGEDMLMTSSIGTLNLLRLAQHANAKYLFASSAEVYGDPGVFPQTESYHGDVDPVGPRSAYEEGKRFGESLTNYFSKCHGVDARIVRIFNTYGPNMSLKESRVIPAMLRSMILGEPVTIYGNGRNTRSFQYVDDLISGFDHCMSIKCQGDVFNIGSEEEISIMELFEACKEVTGSKSRPHFVKHFIEDHKRRRPDTSRIRALGWSPVIALRKGLKISYDDIRSRLPEKPVQRRVIQLRPARSLRGSNSTGHSMS